MSRGGANVSRPAYETARLALARVRVDTARDRADALRAATKLCAQTLEVERVGIWFIQRRSLFCEVLYERTPDRHRSGSVLELSRYPIYAAALRERRAVVASEAATDPRTCELLDDYLMPAGISSVLDAPLYIHGRVVGVVCHEHVGEARAWSQSEVDFASSVADMVSTILEQSSRAEAEAELSERAWHSSELHRLELLSELAGAIAHDFNNVLASVGLVSQSLAKGASADEIGQAVISLEESVNVGQRLVRHLGALRDRTVSEGNHTTLVCESIQRLAHLLSPLLRANAQLVLELGELDAEVALSATHLDQLIMNLCLNARDAIGAQGTVRVRVRATAPNEGRAECIAIDVEDDGAGIPAELISRIFDPYFTTKATGSGQGLATVKRVVEGVGGSILLRSDTSGTCFTILLPRVTKNRSVR